MFDHVNSSTAFIGLTFSMIWLRFVRLSTNMLVNLKSTHHFHYCIFTTHQTIWSVKFGEISRVNVSILLWTHLILFMRSIGNRAVVEICCIHPRFNRHVFIEKLGLTRRPPINYELFAHWILLSLPVIWVCTLKIYLAIQGNLPTSFSGRFTPWKFFVKIDIESRKCLSIFADSDCFDWSDYLNDTNALAAPVSCFRHVSFSWYMTHEFHTAIWSIYHLVEYPLKSALPKMILTGLHRKKLSETLCAFMMTVSVIIA